MANAREYGADSVVSGHAVWPSDISGFVVATPTATHLDVVEPLLKLGRPIFVEKPLSNDLDRVRTLPESAFGQTYVMHKWRYHPAIAELRRIRETGELGPALGVRTRRVQGFNPHRDVDAIWILAPHDLSIVLHILGDTPTAIRAIADPLCPGGGLIAELRCGGVPVVIEVSAGHVATMREVQVRFRDGVARLSGEDYQHIEIHRLDGEIEKRSVGADLPLAEELKAFVRFVQGGDPIFTSLAEEISLLSTLVDLRKMIGLDAD